MIKTVADTLTPFLVLIRVYPRPSGTGIPDTFFPFGHSGDQSRHSLPANVTRTKENVRTWWFAFTIYKYKAYESNLWNLLVVNQISRAILEHCYKNVMHANLCQISRRLTANKQFWAQSTCANLQRESYTWSGSQFFSANNLFTILKKNTEDCFQLWCLDSKATWFYTNRFRKTRAEQTYPNWSAPLDPILVWKPIHL